MQDKPNSIGEVTIFQIMSSALMLTLREKGLTEEQIGLALHADHTEHVKSLMNLINDYADAIIEAHPLELGPVTEPWMVEVANRAVKANLSEDGDPKYDSAQGYACALEALKIAFKWRPTEINPDAVPNPRPVDEPQRMQMQEILSNAKNLFDATSRKYGDEEAAKEVFAYISEKNGIAAAELLGLSDADTQEIHAKIIEVMKGQQHE